MIALWVSSGSSYRKEWSGWPLAAKRVLVAKPAQEVEISYGHARKVINAWRNDYNITRPHSSLEGLTPIQFATRSTMDHNMNRANL